MMKPAMKLNVAVVVASLLVLVALASPVSTFAQQCTKQSSSLNLKAICPQDATRLTSVTFVGGTLTVDGVLFVINSGKETAMIWSVVANLQVKDSADFSTVASVVGNSTGSATANTCNGSFTNPADGSLAVPTGNTIASNPLDVCSTGVSLPFQATFGPSLTGSLVVGKSARVELLVTYDNAAAGCSVDVNNSGIIGDICVERGRIKTTLVRLSFPIQ